MEKHEIESIIEHSLRPLEKKLEEFVGVKERLTKLEKIARIVVTVAAIFGFFGLSGAVVLSYYGTRIGEIDTRIDETEKEQVRVSGLVNSLEIKARELEGSIDEHQEDIRKYREEQTMIFDRDLSRRANAAIENFEAQTDGNLKEKIEDLTFRRLKVNSLSVVGKEGEKVAKLRNSATGGSLELYNKEGDLSFEAYSTEIDAVVSIYSVVDDEEIIRISGALDADGAANGSEINLYNSDGDIGISAHVGGPTGSIGVFSTSTENMIAELGRTSAGDGALWLFNAEGFNGITAAMAKLGGSIALFSTETKKRIAALGVTTEQAGALELSDKEGKLFFRE